MSNFQSIPTDCTMASALLGLGGFGDHFHFPVPPPPHTPAGHTLHMVRGVLDADCGLQSNGVSGSRRQARSASAGAGSATPSFRPRPTCAATFFPLWHLFSHVLLSSKRSHARRVLYLYGLPMPIGCSLVLALRSDPFHACLVPHALSSGTILTWARRTPRSFSRLATARTPWAQCRIASRSTATARTRLTRRGALYS